ncbi:hypothetical protein MY11210_000746 [Beauveria gryllotalpidicola]
MLPNMVGGGSEWQQLAQMQPSIFRRGACAESWPQFISTMVETARAAIEERDASGYFSWVRFGTVEWRSVMRDRGRHLLQGPEFNDEAIEAVDEFNDRLAEIPAVVKVGLSRDGSCQERSTHRLGCGSHYLQACGSLPRKNVRILVYIYTPVSQTR